MKNLIRKNILLLLSLLSTANFAVSQNSNVWGSVDDLKKLESSTEYLAVAKTLNIKYQQALSNSRDAALLKVYEFSCDCDEVDLYIAINKVKEIKGVEYGPKYESLALPNDYTMTFDPMWSLDLINAEGAWDYTHGDTSINVAISDQNYFIGHEELIGKVMHYDASNTTSQTHGTAVACIAAGNTNNGIGLSSIGYDLKLGLYQMSYNDVIEASNAGARVINLSWTSGCQENQYLQGVINSVYDNGTFIVAAAGNGSTCGGPENLVYPAAYENVFSVTSIGANDNHEQTIGDPTSTHQHNSTVDLSAPGYNVPITAAPGWYLNGSGTSYAAPFVTGTVGLMLSVNPCLSNLEIETYLKQSSTDIDSLNPNCAGLIGAGRLNAARAVFMAQNNYASNMDASFDLTDFCEGANNYASNIVTTGGTFSFDPMPSSGESINSTTGEITGGIVGTTYAIKHVISGGYCSDSTIQSVTINALPIVSAGMDQTVCNDGAAVTLEGSGAATYVWDNGVIDGESFIPPVGITAYTVIGTDVNGCANTFQLGVQVNDLPTVSAGMDQTVCNDGNTLTLEGSGAITYEWDYDGLVNGVSFTPLLGTTTFTVTGTDANGCSNTDQVDVTVNDLPVVSAGTDQTICNDGTTVILNGSGATTYVWDNGVADGVSFTPPLGTTTYAVTGTDANGCSNTDQVDVTVNTLPSVWAGLCQTTFWGYTNYYAEVELNGITSGGYGATTSVWTDQNGNVVGTSNPTSFLTNASTVDMGDYITSTYTLTSTDQLGCTESDDVEVTTYNVICPKPNANMNTIPNINNRKIMVCSKGGFRCVPYNAVANVLDACQNCKLGPCNAIWDCKGYAEKSTIAASFEKAVINVYPNPSNGIINIVSEDQQTINKLEVFSLMGQLILTQYNGQTFSVDLTNQSTGIYLVKAYVGNQIATVVISRL